MKHDWKKLEREFILSDYKTVTSFLKSKNIKSDGTTRKYTTGWKEKKRQKCDKSTTKIIEKVIEKEAEKKATEKVKINDVVNDLLEKISQATKQLNMNSDMFGRIHTNEIINRSDIKKLTSALKDIADITKNNKESEQNKTPEIKISIVDNSDLESDLWRDFNDNK